ncbi:MAG: (Fe-S)-binding protein [Pseudomonadales bacterium]
MTESQTQKSEKLTIGLFATCAVDMLRPAVGFATAKVLEQAGCEVHVPAQSCCGQIGYNNGQPDAAREMAWTLITAFHEFDYTVVPSGSCGGMIKIHYPSLFRYDDRLAQVEAFCAKVFELTVFLKDVLDFKPQYPNCDLADKTITYHDSCAGLREFGIKIQPRELIRSCNNNTVTEMTETEVCCGFGGTFCVKFPEIANRMVENKASNARATNAHMLVGGDLSCLLHIAGKMRRQNDDKQIGNPEVRHIAELLAGELDHPPIGEAIKRKTNECS